MRRMVLFLLIAAMMALLPGCGPAISKGDLGEVQTKASDLPGAGKAYDLPKPQYESQDEPDEVEKSDSTEASPTPEAS